jgi:hypothetical protein
VLGAAKSLEANSLICKMIGSILGERKCLERMDSAVQPYSMSPLAGWWWCVWTQPRGELGVTCDG